MNRQEKLTAILERLKAAGSNMDGEHISTMVIVGYMDDLAKQGLIETPFGITSSGNDVRAICEEFDWKPDNDEVRAFVMEMVEEKERPAIMFMIKKYRDDRDGLLEDFKKAQSSFGDESPTS